MRRYLREQAPAGERRTRGSLLDPYKAEIAAWVQDDRLLNCPTMLVRLREQGYTGGLSVLKSFVHPLRPAGRPPAAGTALRDAAGPAVAVRLGRVHL